MRKLRRLFLLALPLAAVCVAQPVKITEYPLPSGNTYSLAITSGPDGNLWFTNLTATGGSIGRITPAGVITEFPVPNVSAGPSAITAGPDGNLWFVGLFGNYVGKITPAGVFTLFTLANGNNATWYGITAGPDGNIWFTELNPFGTGGGIGRITPAGVMTEFEAPAGTYPINITTGPDGSLWFTAVSGAAGGIGKITPNGAMIMEYPVAAGPGFSLLGIVTGADGNLWFTDQNGNRVGKVAPGSSGAATEFPVPTANAAPAFITAGPDGNLWFTESGADKLAKITPGGAITELPVPPAPGPGPKVSPLPVKPAGITVGPDGNLWFTELTGNNIGIAPVFVPATGNDCNGTFSGTFDGNIMVTAGQVCNFTLGTITGGIQLNKGGQLILSHTTVGGNVIGDSNNSYSIRSSVISGNFQMNNMPPSTLVSVVCGSTINGNLALTNDDVPMDIGGSCSANQIGGNLQITNNTAPVQVSFNTVGKNLQCQNNTSITGTGNTAKQKQDQCASF